MEFVYFLSGIVIGSVLGFALAAMFCVSQYHDK
jgi:hypothetical protein